MIGNDVDIEEIKDIYEKGQFSLNGAIYHILNMTHKQRRKVFAYFTSIHKQLSVGDFGFMDTVEFDAIEETISNLVTYDGSLISKIPNHWDQHPGDYMTFVITTMGVISYPFLAGNLGG